MSSSPAVPQTIVILGCGRVGATLAKKMSGDGHTVAIIDMTSDAFRRLGTKFKGLRIVGTGLDQDILRKAGIERADIFIAVTQGDNTNIMAVQIAKDVFAVEHVVARLYDPIRAQAYREMGITTLCTTTLAAGLIQDAALGTGEYQALQSALQDWDQTYLEQKN